jgi:hypothetical protein
VLCVIRDLIENKFYVEYDEKTKGE